MTLGIPNEQRVTTQKLAAWSEKYAKARTQQVAQRSVMKNGILASAENIELVEQLSPANFAFSVDVDSEAVANQRQSGRCWMFAGLNTLRWHIEKKLELPHGTFELSQAFLTFYNKLERAAWFLQNVVDTADREYTDREVEYLFQAPMQDGGYWDWIAGLIAKYGVVPHSAMAETHCTNDTSELNAVLSNMLRKDGVELREAAKAGNDTAPMMDEMLGEVYTVLCVCVGEPPRTFDFQYMDKNKKYHQDLGLTPLKFLEKYVPINVADYIAVSNFPGADRPFCTTYTVDLTGQIPNRELLFLNVSLEDLKDLALKQLGADGGKGEPVWFTSDVLACSDITRGVMSPELYDLDAMFGTSLLMPKDIGLDTQQYAPDHAMVLAGVDIVDGKPAKWKVENSWGTTNDGKKTGYNGYFAASDDWFDHFVFCCAIRKDLLSADQQKALEAEPVRLPFYSVIA